jgi:hypothetical protein
MPDKAKINRTIRSPVVVSAWISGSFTLIAALVALAAFLFTSELKSPPKPSPTPTPATISFTGTVGLNLDTNPPTVGPTTTSALTFTMVNNAVYATAKIPSSLAYIADDTNSPPLLSACQTAIASHPTLVVTMQNNKWVCVRTVAGATKAVHVTTINSLNVEIQIFALRG